jgi:hypothetical protein
MEITEKRATYVRLIIDEPTYRSSIEEVESRDISKLNLDETVSSFYFFEMIIYEREIDNQKVGFKSTEFNVGERHFYGGEIISREQHLKTYPESLLRLLSEDEFSCARSKNSIISILEKKHIFVPSRT